MFGKKNSAPAVADENPQQEPAKKPFWPALRTKLRASFHTRSFHAGLYSTFASLAVIAIVIVVVLLVNKIPSQYTKIDVSNNKLFTISEQTEQLLTGLDDDVTLYLIAQNGQADSTIQLLLNRYAGYSDKVKVVVKDPVVYPNFAAQYTTETVSNNSVLVVCGDRSSFVSYDSIYVADYTNYYTTGTTETNFDGESAITSAINYVTSDHIPVIYSLTGHGETDLDATMSSALTKENMKVQTLSLLESDAIPADAACLLIHNPTKDLSADESDIVLSYLQSGGRMVVITDYLNVASLTNLKALLANYGVNSVDSCVLEGDADCYYRAAYYMLPTINSHTVTDPLIDGKYYILMPYAHGLQVSETADSSLKITQLLTTSSSAYAKTSGGQYVAKEDGDTTGTFALGVTVEQAVEGGTTEIAWFSSASAFTQSYNEAVSGANGDLFVNTFGWMCEAENSISIHAKSLSTEYLTVTSAQSSAASFLLIGVIPLAFVLAGILIWLRRRKG